MKQIHGNPNDNKSTLQDCLSYAIKKGYVENFQMINNSLSVHDDRLYYYPSDVVLKDKFHFENQFDSADNSTLYLIETCDGRRGTMIDACGPYPNSRLSKFMREVEGIREMEKSRKWKFSLSNMRMSFLRILT